LPLGRISVTVRHGKVAAEHCSDCGAAEGRTGKIDSFERIIAVDAPIDPTLQDKLAEIADKCPVHRTLEAKSAIVTSIETAI
jgi:putative redox protein